jgi:hypothetical protein
MESTSATAAQMPLWLEFVLRGERQLFQHHAVRCGRNSCTCSGSCRCSTEEMPGIRWQRYYERVGDGGRFRRECRRGAACVTRAAVVEINGTSAAGRANRRRTANPDLPRFVYPNGKKYRALVRRGYEILYLGTFDTPEQVSEFAQRLAKSCAASPTSRQRSARLQASARLRRANG